VHKDSRKDYVLYVNALLHKGQNHRHAVAQPCVNGDRLSQWKMAKFDPSQIWDPSTNR